MNLSLYDPQLNRIAIIEGRFVSCMWSEGYNTTQPFTLELLATAEYKQKVKPDCYVGRDDRKTLITPGLPPEDTRSCWSRREHGHVP